MFRATPPCTRLTPFAARLVRRARLADAYERLGAAGHVMVGADAAGRPLDEVADALRAQPSLALVVASEAHGLSAESRAVCETLVAIPMAPPVESLNVAVSAGILMHRLSV